MKTMALVAMMCAAAIGQSAGPSVAGTWIAQLEGRTYVRLELANASGTIKGGITLGNIEFDKSGSVGKAGEPPRTLKTISETVQQGAVVTFSVASSDDADRFEFRLIDAGRAELKLILSEDQREELADMGIAALKPIPLTKQ
jgi:hypothetical protein